MFIIAWALVVTRGKIAIDMYDSTKIITRLFSGPAQITTQTTLYPADPLAANPMGYSQQQRY